MRHQRPVSGISLSYLGWLDSDSISFQVKTSNYEQCNLPHRFNDKKKQPNELQGRKLNEPEPRRALLLMVLVAGYLVTTQPSFFSLPPLQPIPFVILSSSLSITFSFVFIPLILNGKLFCLLCTLFRLWHVVSTLLLNALLSFFTFSPSPSLLSLNPVLHPSFPCGFWPAPRCFLSPFVDSLHLFLPLSSPSSHFHVAGWAATLRVFIAAWARGGGLLPGTNGLWENTDSHASHLQNRGERGWMWSEAWGERKEWKTSEGQGASQENVEVKGIFLTKSPRAFISKKKKKYENTLFSAANSSGLSLQSEATWHYVLTRHCCCLILKRNQIQTKAQKNTSLPQRDINHLPQVSRRDSCHQWRRSVPVPGRCPKGTSKPQRAQWFTKCTFISPHSTSSTPLLRRPPPPNLIWFCSAITSPMLNMVCGVAVATGPPPMWSQVKEWDFIGLYSRGGVSVDETHVDHR